MSAQNLSLLPTNEVVNVNDDAISPSDLGYNPLAAIRPARELLHKKPRRRSSASIASVQSEIHRSVRLTPPPTNSVSVSSSPSGGGNQSRLPASVSPLLEEELLPLQSFDPINSNTGLTKPTPVAAHTIERRGSFPKPADPALEKEARKSLLLLSRKRPEHPGEDVFVQHQQQQQHASVFVGGELTSPKKPRQQRPQAQSHGSKIVPIGGMRGGQFLFTGIVMRRDGRYPNGKVAQVAFLKLDNPTGRLDGPGHLMKGVEFQTEMASFQGSAFDRQWKIHTMPLMDLASGFPLDPITASNCNSELGLAHLPGHEQWLSQTCPLAFDAPFPYLSFQHQPNNAAPFGTVQMQGVRAGDVVTVLVCGRRQGKAYRRPLHVGVISVTSFGLVNGVATDTFSKNDIFCFPMTSVLGVQYGKHWKKKKTTSSRQARAAILSSRQQHCQSLAEESS